MNQLVSLKFHNASLGGGLGFPCRFALGKLCIFVVALTRQFSAIRCSVSFARDVRSRFYKAAITRKAAFRPIHSLWIKS